MEDAQACVQVFLAQFHSTGKFKDLLDIASAKERFRISIANNLLAIRQKSSTKNHQKSHQSAGDNCSDPGYDQNTYEYGNGIFKFYEQSIGGRDVTVCQLVDPESGETANYIPVQGTDNVSKDWVIIRSVISLQIGSV